MPQTAAEAALSPAATIQLDGSNSVVEHLTQRRGTQEAISIHYRIGAGGLPSESLRWISAYDLRPDRTPTEIVIVRVTSHAVDGDLTRAQRNLDEFMSALGPEFLRTRGD